jgi:hypothetical protein
MRRMFPFLTFLYPARHLARRSGGEHGDGGMEGVDWRGNLSVLAEEDLSGDRSAEAGFGPEVSSAFPRLSENEKR